MASALTTNVQPTARSAPVADTRMVWLDQAKGVGIVLVVVGHAWVGKLQAGILDETGVVRAVDTVIYSFHMPLFFLVSGYTFEAWARRRSPAGALWSRVMRLLWPMVLWTYIFAAFKLAAGQLANAPVGLDDVLTWPLPPQNHFWFLWALFVLHAIGIAVCALSSRPLPHLAWGGLMLLVLAVVLSQRIDFGVLFSPAANHAAIFLFGIVLARFAPPPRSLVVGLGAAALFALVAALNFAFPQTLWSFLAVSVTLSVALCLAFAGLMPRDGAVGAGLARLGVLSMPIFLAHTIFSAATRIGLQRITADPALHLILGTLAGIAGPLALYALLRRYSDPRFAGF